MTDKHHDRRLRQQQFDEAHARLVATLNQLVDAQWSKDERAGTGSCGSPAHPDLHAEIDRLHRKVSTLWEETSPDYQRAVRAADAATREARQAEMDAPELTLADIEAQQDALYARLAEEDGLTAAGGE